MLLKLITQLNMIKFHKHFDKFQYDCVSFSMIKLMQHLRGFLLNIWLMSYLFQKKFFKYIFLQVLYVRFIFLLYISTVKSIALFNNFNDCCKMQEIDYCTNRFVEGDIYIGIIVYSITEMSILQIQRNQLLQFAQAISAVSICQTVVFKHNINRKKIQ